MDHTALRLGVPIFDRRSLVLFNLDVMEEKLANWSLQYMARFQEGVQEWKEL